MIKRLSLIVLLLLLCGLPATAGAQQGSLSITASVTETEVEVGEPFQVQLRAEVQDRPMPNDPQLTVPPAMSARGPNNSTTGLSLQFGGGPMQMKRTLVSTWHVVASETGTFTIPNPTVSVDGERHTASGRMVVKVVPEGQGKPKTRRRQRSPFGGFGSFFGGGSSPFDFNFGTSDPIWDEDADDPADLEPRARELMLPSEPEQYVFLRMIPDKAKAVVGEQVTLSYYVYFRADMKLTDQREPPLSDFVRMEMDRAHNDRAIITSVGRWRYHVKLLDRVAIFPLRAGKLATGSLTGKFQGRRFGNKELTRKSQSVSITVREPPREGRPLGYRIGDVGRYKLTAEVKPRETRVGDTVAVVVRLSGLGNLPNDLRIPERTGIEWLDPEKKAELSVRSGKIAGWRTFGYAVRFKEQGDIPLGAVELSYWDPQKKRYATTSVELGNVLVQAGPKQETKLPEDERSDDPFANIAKPRLTMAAYAPPSDPTFDPNLLWALIAVPPLGIAASQIFVGVWARMRRRRDEAKADPARLAKQALKDGRSAGEPKDAAAAYERAIHLAIEAATGIKSRGVLMSELADKLRADDIEEELCDDVIKVLDKCSALRFDPDPDEESKTDLRRLSEHVVKALL